MTVIDDVWERLISYTPLLFFPLLPMVGFRFLSCFVRFFHPLSLFSSRFMGYVSPTALGMGIS